MSSSYYVDNSVGGTNSGTQANPWTSLASINWITIGAASKPCTIYISGGASSQTYSEMLYVDASGSGEGSEIIIKRPTSAEWSGHSGIVYIEATNNDGTYIDGDYIIIDGINSRTYPSDGNSSGFGIPGRNNITLKNCTSQQNDGCGIGGNADNLTVQNCILGPNTDGGNDPMQFRGLNNVIEYSILTGHFPTTGEQHFDLLQIGNGSASSFTLRYNIFREANSAGIAVYSHDMAAGENVTLYIYGNIFEFTNAGSNGQGNCPAVSLGGTTAWVKAYIYNNVFVNWSYETYGTQAVGVGGTNASNVSDIRNNIFYNSGLGIDQASGGTQTSDYNIFYMTYDGNMNSWNGTAYTQSQFAAYKTASGQDAHSLNTDPLLTSVNGTLSTAHDLRPTSTSPGINVGTTLGAPYDNGLTMADVKSAWPLTVAIAARVGGYDIGAYEFGAAFILSASANISASGEATTAQLTAPSGKDTGDFQAGRIQDDENPCDSLDLAVDEYTEIEWCIEATDAAEMGETYEFRVTKV